MLQYQRRQNQIYNEILQKQRRKVELRALEKQREKERRRRREEEQQERAKLNSKDSTVASDESVRTSRRTRSYQENFLSSESEYETTFQVRTRRQKSQISKNLEPLNIQIESSEATTTTLLSQIDAHLEKPEPAKSNSFEAGVHNRHPHTQVTNNDDNEQTCDINSGKSQMKMRELNLLADIAQHLSPYQLDLFPSNSDSPKNNHPRSPLPSTELSSITKLTPHTASLSEVPKEKAIVTENLFIQPIDNLLENKKSQVDINFPQQQALSSYAHEPKLNITAVSKSGSSADFMQNENHLITDSQTENNDTQNTKQNPTIQTDETLEKILEESISALAVTNSYNPLNEQQMLQSDTAIPILISNVESLNQQVQSDIVRHKSEENMDFHVKNSIKSDSENLVLPERKEKTYDNIKDFGEKDNAIRNSTSDLSLNILNNVESSIMCATDIVNIPSVRNDSQTLNVTPLTAADLSDISIESEISKHLSEIAEPSPVVTDISDNSNESNVSKSLEHQLSKTNNSTASTATNNEMSLPDLSLDMPNIIQSSTTSQQDSLETSFSQLNSSLNTPIKLPTEISKEEELTKRPTNELNTSLKFAMQSELENNSTPLKTCLEPEADTNVTKFLDLILNKTVTDAESETRDKIIKELNALTADAALASEANENTLSNSEIIQPESQLNVGQNKSIDSEKQVETNNCVEKQIDKEIDLKLQNISPTDDDKSDKTSECSSCSRKDINVLGKETTLELKAATEKPEQLRTPSANNDLNPPKANLEEDHRELLCDMKTTESSSTLTSTSLSPSAKPKNPFTALNINCRVRLKRLYVANSTITKTESMPAIHTTNPVELLSSNNDLTKYDLAKEKPAHIKKACLKANNKQASKELDKPTENISVAAAAPELTPTKKPKLDSEKSMSTDTIQATTSENPEQQDPIQISKASETSVNSTIAVTKPKSKSFKTVTFDLSNLNEEFRDSTTSYHKHKSKGHVAMGCFLKSSRTSRKLPDNTLRAAETLQLFVNTINARARSPPPAEFNKKRSPIKNKCIAEDETPRPPPASSLMGTPPCKKVCIEKSRNHLTSKCKDQLVSSLTTSSIPSITSDISTARIYTSSPLDQTLPEYDDNVDTVGDSELILPTTTGSLRRKLKRPKKSLVRPEPADDVCTDGIVNQPDCNREDDTDAVVDNEDDDFAEELLPIPAANEHILEEIVSARQTHIGTSTVIRDEYMNIEATATVPVYLFNDESRDLGSPEVIQSSDNTNVVDSSSYLNAAPTAAPNNVGATSASTTSAMGILEKSMLSPSEHEVSSTQETFYQTPIKNKQTEILGEKSSTSKEKGNSSAGQTTNIILKQKSEENNTKNKDDYQTSSNAGLLQNNQVDTTNHSPEMCSLALTATTTNTPNLASNRKIRKASTHDEILFNELQQQLPPTKRKSNNTTFCVESTSGNSNNPNKSKVIANNLDDIKSNGSLAKVDDKFKKLLKDVCKIDKHKTSNVLDVGLASASNNGGGGSSPSTTTTINEESLPRSKRKKLKSSKPKKSKNRTERTSKISLKPSKLTPHISANPLIITIPKSRLLRPLSSPPNPIESQDDQQQSDDIFNIPNAKLFIEKSKDTEMTAISSLPATAAVQNTNKISLIKKEIVDTTPVVASKSKLLQYPGDTSIELEKLKSIRIVEPNIQEDTPPKQNSSSNTQKMKKKEKFKIKNDVVSVSDKTITNSNNKLVFAKDKYDLIKSKDKHHHNQDHHDNKDKTKEKTNTHSKSLTLNISRLHKVASKEKVNKGEKSKEKHNKTYQLQPDNVLKSTISQSNSKSSPPATLLPAAQLFSSNIKQSNSKTSKAISSSSSNATVATSAILKSKVNFSTANVSVTTAATAPTQTATATLSTNNR